jgi:hypothetical protein
VIHTIPSIHNIDACSLQSRVAAYVFHFTVVSSLPLLMPFAALSDILLASQARLYQQLAWLVSCGVGIKAAVAHVMQSALEATAKRKVPEDLLQPFPEHLLASRS